MYTEGGRQLSGSIYSIRVIDGNNLAAENIIASRMNFQVQQYLNPKGFTFSNNPAEANLLIMFKVGLKDRTINVPAQSRWGIAWNQYGGSGGGFSHAGYSYNKTDEWLQMIIMECRSRKKVQTIVSGYAHPKGGDDRLLTDDTHLSIAFDKLLNQSLFSSIARAPASGNTGCWKND